MRDLRRLEDWFGSTADACSITPDIIARYLARCSNGSPAITLNRTKTALRVFFKFLTDAGYIESSPARLIKNGRTEPKTPKHLTEAEIRRLLSAIPANNGLVAKRDHVMLTLLLQTGIRLGALVQLKVRDLNLSRGAMTIRAKGGTEKTVCLNSGLRRLLRSYVKGTGLTLSDPLFRSLNGGHLSSRQVQLRFKHWLEVAGLDPKYSVHSLRHTFAMNLYRKTGDLGASPHPLDSFLGRIS